MGPQRISREAVLAKASEVFAGGAEPTMTEVATAAGVSRGALYQLFGSRRALLEELGVEQHQVGPAEIVAAAADIVAECGLAGLTVDEAAARAGASRATAFRLYPGRDALYREVLRQYSPFGVVAETLIRLWDRPPEEVLPEVARRSVGSNPREMGVFRSVCFEVLPARRHDIPEATAFVTEVWAEVGDLLVRYVAEQMAAGRLREMHPGLAVQSLAGPVIMHAGYRDILGGRLFSGTTVSEAIDRLVEEWLRAMQPVVAAEPASRRSLPPKPDTAGRARSSGRRG